MADFLALSKETPFLDLAKAAPALTKLKGTLNWDLHPIYGKDLSQGFDLDIFLFALDTAGKIKFPGDVCFYGNKSLFNGAVTVPKDNRTGEDEIGADGKKADDEYFLADLSRIPADKGSFDVFVFLYDAVARKQNFGQMMNARFEIKDGVTDSLIQAYNITQFKEGTALHVGTVKRNGTGWTFQPVGDAANADPNDVAKAYL